MLHCIGQPFRSRNLLVSNFAKQPTMAAQMVPQAVTTEDTSQLHTLQSAIVSGTVLQPAQPIMHTQVVLEHPVVFPPPESIRVLDTPQPSTNAPNALLSTPLVGCRTTRPGRAPVGSMSPWIAGFSNGWSAMTAQPYSTSSPSTPIRCAVVRVRCAPGSAWLAPCNARPGCSTTSRRTIPKLAWLSLTGQRHDRPRRHGTFWSSQIRGVRLGTFFSGDCPQRPLDP